MAYNPYKRQGFNMACFNVSNSRGVREKLERYKQSQANDERHQSLQNALATLRQQCKSELDQHGEQLNKALQVVEKQQEMIQQLRHSKQSSQNTNDERDSFNQSFKQKQNGGVGGGGGGDDATDNNNQQKDRQNFNKNMMCNKNNNNNARKSVHFQSKENNNNKGGEEGEEEEEEEEEEQCQPKDRNNRMIGRKMSFARPNSSNEASGNSRDRHRHEEKHRTNPKKKKYHRGKERKNMSSFIKKNFFFKKPIK